MAQLVVRKLPDDVKQRLQARAVRHGQSMEAEVRDILRDAVKREGCENDGLGTRIAALFADVGLRPGEELEQIEWEEMRSPFEP